VPVFLGLVSYVLAGRFVERFKLPTYYTPQLETERWALPGPLPTLWLQHHLYHGHTGPLEIFAVIMYLSHFGVALAVAFGLVIVGRSRAFANLMFSILTVSILAEVTFVLAPTAPPWLASEKGYLPPVQHMLKDSLYDLHLTKLANFIGNPHNYDVTAAVPSLHVAFPLLCLFTALRHGLPRWLSILLALNTLGVTFAIVYLGDHYFVDALAGALYAVAAWRLVGVLTARSRTPHPIRSAVAIPARSR
jgi:membrane-associated phospholipid phosphatase